MASCFNPFHFRHTIFIVCVLFIVIVTVTTTNTKSLLSLDEECLALFQFKQSILPQDYASFRVHGFQKFASWNLGSNASENGPGCCMWDGVVCSNKEDENHVIGLDLSQSFLRGPINSSNTLFNLVHLQRLNLAMNDFVESQIPSEIGRLKQLRSLNLSNSGFSGQIPNEISKLMHLSLLDLSRNSLKLQSPRLENLVQNLTGLEELNLSGVDISSSVPHFLANFSSLRLIILSNCNLQNEFPTAILHLPKLEILNVRYNTNLTGFFPEFRNNNLIILRLTATGFSGIIPKSISNLNHLFLLDLSECSFSGHIPHSFANLTELAYLSLAFNEFTGLVPSLVSLSKLIFLDLGDNKFERSHVPDWLSKLTQLESLYLPHMGIYGEIPHFLANLTQLSSIGIAENSLFGHIPSSFMNLTQLSVIDLELNQLQGPISSSFSNFKSLRVLFLGSNNFSGIVGLDIFVGLDKLEDLYLSYNKISFVANNYTNGTLPKLRNLGLAFCKLKEFPPFLRFQNKLAALHLEYNEIDGLVPLWIWNNSQETLQIIDLSYNFITGFQQHPHFLPWIHLETFIATNNKLRGRLPIPAQTTIAYDVSNNKLTGEIPMWICELTSLQLLDLSSNNMTGTLPSCLSSLSNSLSDLDLKQNNFHGTMMNTFMHGCMLKRIDLSENRFQGQVSKSLANCTNLEVLFLGDNSFDDVFPFWLGNLVELQVLILRSNKFHGAIHGPTTRSSQFTKLRIIDLSNNGFSGQLPYKYFQTWNAMKSVYVGKSSVMQSRILFGTMGRVWQFSMTLTNKGVKTKYEKILNIFIAIDLSSNNFEGEISQSLQDLQGLESLNLSNNHLTGCVLPSLGNLKNLESLDLSQNELSGEIPHQLLQLGFLSILNVSFNHLDGRIPQGKQFNTFDNSSYKGNPRLCGAPLSKECQNSKVPTPPPLTSNKSESLLPSERVDWIIIFSGVGSGLIVGIVIGEFLNTKYSDWLMERFGKRNERWVKPLSNRRRNKGLAT